MLRPAPARRPDSHRKARELVKPMVKKHGIELENIDCGTNVLPPKDMVLADLWEGDHYAQDRSEVLLMVRTYAGENYGPNEASQLDARAAGNGAWTKSAQAFEWTGSLLGLLGAFLLATNTRVSRYGRLAFLAANLAMIAWACWCSSWVSWARPAWAYTVPACSRFLASTNCCACIEGSKHEEPQPCRLGLCPSRRTHRRAHVRVGVDAGWG